MAVKRLIRAEEENTIQGFHDSCFWERNSLADQKVSKLKNRVDKSLAGLSSE